MTTIFGNISEESLQIGTITRVPHNHTIVYVIDLVTGLVYSLWMYYYIRMHIVHFLKILALSIH